MLSVKNTLRFFASLAAPALYWNYFRGSEGNGKTQVCFSFDCDLAEDYEKLPALLETLSSFKVKGTFGIIGKWLEKDPLIHQRLVEEGHEIMNHTYSHPNNEVFHPDEYFNQLTPEAQAKQIEDFHACAEMILGVTPVGFRTPHFGDLHTPHVYEVLENLGYLYSTSTIMTKTKSRGQPYYPSKKNYLEPGGVAEEAYKVLEIPSASCPIHYFPAFDTVHCLRQKEPAHTKDFPNAFAKAVDIGVAHGIPLAFDFGPQDIGGVKAFEEILEKTISDKRVSVMKCEELAHSVKKE